MGKLLGRVNVLSILAVPSQLWLLRDLPSNIERTPFVLIIFKGNIAQTLKTEMLYTLYVLMGKWSGLIELIDMHRNLFFYDLFVPIL